MFATLCGIVLLSALCHLFASGTSLSGTVSFAVKLCSFSAISATAVSSLSRLESFFSSLFSAVAVFQQYGAALRIPCVFQQTVYAIGGYNFLIGEIMVEHRLISEQAEELFGVSSRYFRHSAASFSSILPE